MRKNFSVLTICTLFLVLILTGCNNSPLNPKEPVTLTMWHNYGGDMQTAMDILIDEFNSTVGREKGIVIDVTAISSSSELNKSLTIIANDDPGAPDMPDIFTGYPKIASSFYEKGMLCNLDNYFSDEELSLYVDEFVAEGRLDDGGLYVFPIAKSTEILYLNQTLFDEFSAETGANINKLSTFEGISELSSLYYSWTDSKTPDILNDGKQFFSSDSWFNLAEVGMEQLGTNIFNNELLYLNNDKYKHIFDTIYTPAVTGGIALYDGYTSDLSKTGDLVCSTGSSAGILFYGDDITLTDGTVVPVTYNILPYPVFENGTKTALQRGGGLIVAKNDEKKEFAASVFIKWLTSTEQNMEFIEQTGYLPVTKDAFENKLPAHLNNMENGPIKKMLTAVLSMYKTYNFFYAPNYSNFDEISSKYEKNFYNLLTNERNSYKSLGVYNQDIAFSKLK